MKVIETTYSKLHKLSTITEDILRAGGELMHCIDKMSDDSYMYDERRGMRYDDDYDMNERRYSRRYR